jgi:hypothetical protein
VEAFREGVVAVLGAGDFDIVTADEFFSHWDEWFPRGIEGVIEATGKEAGLEAGGAEQRLLGQGDAFDGKELLGIDRLVDGDEVGLQIGDLLEVFEADHSERGGGEAVLTSVLRGAGLALGGGGSSGVNGVGAIGSQLFWGDRLVGAGHEFRFRSKI